jgi:hypothetical protein
VAPLADRGAEIDNVESGIMRESRFNRSLEVENLARFDAFGFTQALRHNAGEMARPTQEKHALHSDPAM